MDPKHRKCIDDNLDELTRRTNSIDDIIEILYNDKILNVYMVNVLKRYDGIDRNIEFYEMIKGRGPTAFKQLLGAFRATGNFRAEQILNKERIYIPTEPEELEFSQQIIISEDVPDATATIDVKTHPEQKFMDVDEEHLPNGTYQMRSTPRGYALIINIHKIKDEEPRMGSEVDFDRLKKLFTALNFKVEPYVDLEKKRMVSVLKSFANNAELANVDSLVVFIMSHGVQNTLNEKWTDIRTSDGDSINSNEIAEIINNSIFFKSEKGQRKPKMLFFQACRMSQSENTLKLNLALDSRVEPDTLLLKGPQVEPEVPIRRSYEDMFQIFSTVPGYPSLRDKKTGAWFVSTFCEIVAENAWRYDLETMLGQVDKEIRKKRDENYGCQSMEVCKGGTSNMKVFFNPGLTLNSSK